MGEGIRKKYIKTQTYHLDDAVYLYNGLQVLFYASFSAMDHDI